MVCIRCGYLSLKKNDVKKHLTRKNICEAKYTNASQEDCLKIINSKDSHTAVEILMKEIKNETKNHTNFQQENETLRRENEKLKEKLKQFEIHSHDPTEHDVIYIIHEREFVNSNKPIYKIGKTTNFKNRMRDYPKGSNIKMVYPCKDVDKTEKDLIGIFDNFFNKREDIGAEYYQGNLGDMRNLISIYINKQTF